MPINPGTTTLKDEVDIGDEGTYIMYTRPMSGSGGTRCSGVNDWIQYYSVRKTARQCGTDLADQALRRVEGPGACTSGTCFEAKVLVEVGGGTGKVDLPDRERDRGPVGAHPEIVRRRSRLGQGLAWRGSGNSRAIDACRRRARPQRWVDAKITKRKSSPMRRLKSP